MLRIVKLDGVNLSKTPDTVYSETEWHPWPFRDIKFSISIRDSFVQALKNEWKIYKLCRKQNN